MSNPTLISGKQPPFTSPKQDRALALFFAAHGLLGFLWILLDANDVADGAFNGFVYLLLSMLTARSFQTGAGPRVIFGVVRLFLEWIWLIPDSERKDALMFGWAPALDVVVVLAAAGWLGSLVVRGLRGPWSLSRAYWPSVWRQFRKNNLALLGLAFAGFLGGTALFSDFLASDQPILMSRGGSIYVFPNLFRYKELLREDLFSLDKAPDLNWKIEPLVPYGPLQDRVEGQLAVESPPTGAHWLGTDNRGRDVLSRLIHGARISLSVGFVSVSIYVMIGLLLGSMAGYFGGLVDNVVSRLTEILLSFPPLVLILALVGSLERPSIYWVMFIIGFTGWPSVSRLIRAEILKYKTMDFVTAARALGVPSSRIITKHILPNALGPVLVSATFGIASAILLEAGLSFLGVGVQPPIPSWGEVLLQARQNLQDWWLWVFPGFAIFLSVMSYNLVGEGFRDAIDPKLKKD